MINIKYSALTIEMIPRLMTAYADCYAELENKGMSEVHQSNLLAFVIANYAKPDFLFLIACSGKKIAGFILVIPAPNLEGVKAASLESIFVEKEYRQHIEIAKTLFDLTVGWAKNKSYKQIFLYENINENKWDRKKQCGFKPVKKLLMREV